MGRPERPLDPEAGSVQRFAWELRRLREKTGSPSYRQLSRRAHFSPTALSEAAGGEQFPSRAVALAYVRACDGDVAAWEDRWRAVAAEVAPGRVGTDTPPYPGLAAFQPEDAARFFGREALVAELVDRVSKQWVVGVFGPSGGGRSSLLRAGLVSAAPWRSVLLTPTAFPAREWAERVVDEVELVVVDQFEEVFTLCVDQAERERFAAALTGSGKRVVFACRADFRDRCARLPGLAAVLRAGQVRVEPMNGEDLRRVIEEPARRHGLRVDPDLVSVALTEVPGQAGALSLLSHALLETWRRRENGRLTLDGYRAAGGLAGPIATMAERAFTALAPRAQVVARGVLLRLVSGEHDPRRRAPLAEVLAAGEETETAAVVEALTAARVVVVAESTVELAHASLSTAWPRLREWVTADRESLRVHRDLTAAALVWESHDRDPGALYRGVRLAAATALAEHPDWPLLSTPAEREFLGASSEQERGTGRQRTRQLIQALGMLLVAGLVLVAVATHWVTFGGGQPAAPPQKCQVVWPTSHDSACRVPLTGSVTARVSSSAAQGFHAETVEFSATGGGETTRVQN
ncbi:hypothetical protein [Actinophytocola sp.]|uniref:nSTAND1 domain-containing NTPase n=1 Tax=Actinophytocola sp. TaxID=1872138 RepID=UPI00389A4B8B